MKTFPPSHPAQWHTHIYTTSLPMHHWSPESDSEGGDGTKPSQTRI